MLIIPSDLLYAEPWLSGTFSGTITGNYTKEFFYRSAVSRAIRGWWSSIFFSWRPVPRCWCVCCGLQRSMVKDICTDRNRNTNKVIKITVNLKSRPGKAGRWEEVQEGGGERQQWVQAEGWSWCCCLWKTALQPPEPSPSLLHLAQAQKEELKRFPIE